MKDYSYITLRNKPELEDAAAEWFHNKWGIPKEAYLECMEEYLDGTTEYVGIYVWMKIKSLVVWA